MTIVTNLLLLLDSLPPIYSNATSTQTVLAKNQAAFAYDCLILNSPRRQQNHLKCKIGKCECIKEILVGYFPVKLTLKSEKEGCQSNKNSCYRVEKLISLVQISLFCFCNVNVILKKSKVS